MKQLQKFRCLIPEWNFFDQPSPEVILQYKIFFNEEPAEWNQFEYKSKLSVFNLFINHLHNQKLFIRMKAEQLLYNKINQTLNLMDEKKLISSLVELVIFQLKLNIKNIKKVEIKLSFEQSDLNLLKISATNSSEITMHSTWINSNDCL